MLAEDTAEVHAHAPREDSHPMLQALTTAVNHNTHEADPGVGAPLVAEASPEAKTEEEVPPEPQDQEAGAIADPEAGDAITITTPMVQMLNITYQETTQEVEAEALQVGAEGSPSLLRNNS